MLFEKIDVSIEETLGKSKQEIKSALNSKELREKLHDPRFLPTHEEIKKAFPYKEAWEKFCFDKKDPIFEFLNQEYLNDFADYLVDRIQKYDADKKPFVILEIGAGNGRLSYFLQQKLEERAPGQTKVVATDSGEWGLKSNFPVERLKHDKAMNKYKPDMVILSWMPPQEDSSKYIRKCDSIKEYILIGRKDLDICGDEWETWGKGRAWSPENDEEVVAPYELDGFEREDLYDLSILQICRNDSPGHFGEYQHSSTVSFRRKIKN